jgi:hypothetical protein
MAYGVWHKQERNDRPLPAMSSTPDAAGSHD